METVGERLRSLRVKAGLSQRNLAQQVGVTYAHISKIESGRENASTALLERIAEAVRADVDALLLLAERLPEDIRRQVFEKADLASRFLRSWRDGTITDGDVEELLRKRASS